MRPPLFAASSGLLGVLAGLALVEVVSRCVVAFGGSHPGGKASRIDFGSGPGRRATPVPPANGVWRVQRPARDRGPVTAPPRFVSPVRRRCGGRYRGSVGRDPSVSVPRPGRHRCVVEDAEGAVIYDVAYTIDRLGRRVPALASDSPRAEYLLLLGCSVAYGEGLQDGEALASILGMQRPDQEPVTYAFSGYGPASVLLRLQRSRLREGIAASTGTVVYLFVDDHVRRTIGTMGIVATWGGRLPYPTLSGSGHPVVSGTFRSGRPLRTALYQLAHRSAFFDVSGIDLPPWLPDDGARLVVGLLSAIRREVTTQLGAGRFFVVLFPGTRSADRLAPLLEAARLATIDYSGTSIEDFTDEPAVIPFDGHPRAPAIRAFGEDLARKLAVMEGAELGT